MEAQEEDAQRAGRVVGLEVQCWDRVPDHCASLQRQQPSRTVRLFACVVRYPPFAAAKPLKTQLASVSNVFKVLGGLAEGDWAVSGRVPPNPWPALPVLALAVLEPCILLQICRVQRVREAWAEGGGSSVTHMQPTN